MDIKCGVLSKHLFERTQQHGGYTKHLGKKKNCARNTFCSYHMESKPFIEESCINDKHTWERTFLQLLLLKVCETFF